MTSRDTAPPRGAPGKRTAPARLSGIDAARGAALLGMMATHLMPTFESDANLTPTWVGLVFSGRSAALFAVLAGIGLALATGKERPGRGPELWASRRGVALRALLIAVVGLMLGGLEVNIAVILVHYAVLFLCMLPFLGLPAKAVCAWAGGWLLFSPVLGYLVRPWLLAATPPLQLGHNPGTDDLETPGRLLADLFFTGYYPVVQWMTYLLVGLAIGRLALSTAAVQLLLLGGGTAVAVAAKLLGVAAMDSWGGEAALQSLPGQDSRLHSLLQVNLAGMEQAGSWWWLASAAPHSGTTLDLLHTAGTAAAVVGLCLLLGRIGAGMKPNVLLPLSGAGAMTLTLYSVHVWVVSGLQQLGLPEGWTPEGMYWVQAIAAVVIGALFALLGRRGPLEWLGHQAFRLGRYRPAGVG